MDEFISTIQFQTAIPFGYLLFAIVWLIAIIWALTTLVAHFVKRRFRAKKLYTAGGLLTVAVGYAYTGYRYNENLNLNPFFDESALIGESHYRGSVLVLRPDGSATISCDDSVLARLGIDNGEGYWRKQHDFNLILGTGSGKFFPKNGLLRVIKYGENYRLIVEDFDDLDMWDGSLGFKR